MELTFTIPDDEYARVGQAFCEMVGHEPCGTQECLLLGVTRIVVGRVTRHEIFKAEKEARSGVPPLNILPQTIPQ